MFGHQDDVQSAASAPPADDNAYLAQSPATPATPLLEPQADDGTPVAASPSVSSDNTRAPAAATPTAGDGSKLLDIKQKALQQLSPLVGQLDQTPEEKFRTTMMMIQAADNQDLIGAAYEAANQISDEKARAQALLDIVNEINYFTQH